MNTPYLYKLWMFHELMVKYIVEIKSTKSQVNQFCSKIGHYPQTENLPQSVILWPRGHVNIRSKDEMVHKVQYMIHGLIQAVKRGNHGNIKSALNYIMSQAAEHVFDVKPSLLTLTLR